ncbi:MAG: hypothetical protein J6T42_01405 [Clostridia bacterium]|nr:hypothetical protein [Clostridia bacterium]
MKTGGFDRVRQMIESDRFGLMGNSKKLILKDITSLLDEYFVLSSGVEMDLDGEENDFTLTVTVRASGVKRFNVLK